MTNMSQEEIDALLQGNPASGGEASEASDEHRPEVSLGETQPSPGPQGEGSETLTQSEIDTLGEIGNISMGSAATSMYSMFDRTVIITTPRVTIFPNLVAMLKAYDRPYVAVQVSYTEGLEGNNILLLKVEDALVITDLMLGGDGVVAEDAELGELQLSAVSEVMNQMVGSSATSMANMLHRTVNISPPITALVQITEDSGIEGFIDNGDPIVRINFDLEIDGVLKSEIMQIMPVGFGKRMVENLVQAMEESMKEPPVAKAPAPAPAQRPAPPPPPSAAPRPAAPAPTAPHPMAAQPMVDVQPVQYQAFDAGNTGAYQEYSENIGIVIDVPLQVTVELGKTRKSIKEILDFGKGSIIVLDKLAGEMVEVMANGKLIARGEVVVIEDNYGVRITEIISAAKRLESLG